MRAISGLIAILALAGCATVTEGTSQTVSLDSDPQGATCDLVRDGQQVDHITTPGAARVSKSRVDILVTCRKAGYEDATGAIKADMSIAFAGNVLVGGAIGLVVDAASGAANKYDGMTVVALTPIPGYVPPPVVAKPAATVAPYVPPPPPPPPPIAFDPPIGQEYRNELIIGGVQVPLLDGTWVVAGKGVVANKPSPNDIAVTLVRIEQGKLWGITHVWAGTRGGNGVGAFRPCGRTDVLHALVVSNVDHGEQDCWIVNHYMMAGARSGATEVHLIQAYSYLDGRGVALPGTMIAAIHRVATPTGYVTVWYRVNPELFGFPAPTVTEWHDSEWHRDRIALDPKRAAFVDALKGLNNDYQGYIRTGFKQLLGDFKGKALPVARGSAAVSEAR